MPTQAELQRALSFINGPILLRPNNPEFVILEFAKNEWGMGRARAAIKHWLPGGSVPPVSARGRFAGYFCANFERNGQVWLRVFIQRLGHDPDNPGADELALPYRLPRPDPNRPFRQTNVEVGGRQQSKYAHRLNPRKPKRIK